MRAYHKQANWSAIISAKGCLGYPEYCTGLPVYGLSNVKIVYLGGQLELCMNLGDRGGGGH